MNIPFQPLSKATMIEAVEALEKHDGHKEKAARSLGIATSTFRNRLNKAAAAGFLGTQPVLPGFAVKQVSVPVGQDGEPVGAAWVKQRPLGEKFEIPDGQVLKEVSALVDPEERVILQWIKTKGSPGLNDLMEAVKETFTEYAGKAPVVPAPTGINNDDMITIYQVADLHYGMYAWAEEAGVDYDTTIATKLLTDTMSRLVADTPSSSTAVVLNLGDYFHFDNDNHRTFRGGNALDGDTRHFKVLRSGVALLIHTILLALKKHAKVIVKNLPGNHDPYAWMVLPIALSIYFKDEPRVEVDATASPYWFYQFGKNMFGATHGDEAKAEDMPGIMAAKQPEMWGATEHRVVFTGHLHTKKKQMVSEKYGAAVEVARTIAPRDAWGNRKGFVSGREMQAITYHREDGEWDRKTVPLGGPR